MLRNIRRLKYLKRNKESYNCIDTSNLKDKKIVCLTLDVEQDYGDLLNEPSYDGLEHIPRLVNFLKERRIPLTCFVQGSLFETHPDRINQLAQLDAEFELHSYSHPKPAERNFKFEIEKGKEVYKKFFDKDPIGYRAPLGVIDDEDYKVLADEGFKFDSSVFPSIRPGAFNNMTKPTKPYFLNGESMVEFPLAVVSDIVRIPLSLSYIKLIGWTYIRLLKTFDLPNLIVFNIHMHDLFHLNSSKKIPLQNSSIIYRRIFKRIYQEENIDGFELLNKIITIFETKQYTFLKMIDIYDSVVRE